MKTDLKAERNHRGKMRYGFELFLVRILKAVKLQLHLMTGPKGYSVFCLPETLSVSRGEAEGNIEVEAGKQNLPQFRGARSRASRKFVLLFP